MITMITMIKITTVMHVERRKNKRKKGKRKSKEYKKKGKKNLKKGNVHLSTIFFIL